MGKQILHRMLNLQGQEWVLLMEALGFLLLARIGLILFPLRRVIRWVPRQSRGSSWTTPHQVAWAVETLARKVPLFRNCLVQALAAHAMLRRRGFPSTLHVGVRREDNRYLFHAWVELSGRPILGGGPGLGFIPLKHWS